MYWQKRFDRVDPNKELEKHILDLHNEHKDFGYRRMKLDRNLCQQEESAANNAETRFAGNIIHKEEPLQFIQRTEEAPNRIKEQIGYDTHQNLYYSRKQGDDSRMEKGQSVGEVNLNPQKSERCISAAKEVRKTSACQKAYSVKKGRDILQ